MFLVGLGTLVSAFLATFFWSFVGERIMVRVRKQYFRSIIGQELGWFDVESAEKMTTRFIENMSKLEGAVGRKNHMLVFSLAMVIGGFAIGFYKGWWFALIVTMSFPIIMIGMISFVVVLQMESVVTKKNYEEAGACSE